MPPTGPDGAEPLDEEFVRRAPATELPGAVRAQRAYRIAAAQEQATPWRAPAEPVPAALRRRRALSFGELGRGLLTVAVVVGLLVLMQRAGNHRFVPDPVNQLATGAPSVPVPADAGAAPLGRPASPPAGEGGFAFLSEHGGRPVAFDPCRPVHFVTRYDGAPPGADALVQSAVAQLSAATGLVLVHDGPTDEAPARDRPPHQPERYGDRWAPVLIAWSSADIDEVLVDAGGYATPVPLDPDGRGPRIVTGQVVVDVDQRDPAVLMPLLLHELGHLAGLDHVDDPTDLMNGETAVLSGYTPGALRGLHALGQGRCFG